MGVLTVPEIVRQIVAKYGAGLTDVDALLEGCHI
jgi:hypothetical protein